MIKNLFISIAIILWFLPFPLLANQDASAAMIALNEASRKLRTVDSKEDRVAALAESIQAMELGLAALRREARTAAIREQTLTTRLAQQESEIAKLISVLQVMGRAPEPVMLFHPMGPTAAARSGMLLSEIAPALQSKTEALRRDLEEIQALRLWQAQAREILTLSLGDLQTARVDLTRAISNRSELPQRFGENAQATQRLVDSARTLDELASGIFAIATDPLEPSPSEIEFATPVLGQVIRGFGQADLAGTERPGWLVATEPGALVTAPSAGTIRYQGPLLDFGTAVVFEPYEGLMIIFAGMRTGYGQTGEVVTKGVPLGLMGGDENTGGERTETLYIEVRDNRAPIDPARIFGQK